MNSQMQPYINLYVKRKGELFPLMYKYSGECPKKMNHGNAVALYVWLLNNDNSFRDEVSGLINKYSNAFGLDLTQLNEVGQAVKDDGLNVRAELNEVGQAVKDDGLNVRADPVSNIVHSISTAVGSIFGYKEEKEKQETALYDAVLQQQGSSDTVKILVVSGIALAFVGLGIFVVIKMRK